MIRDTRLAQLRNFGYTFVVVDYNDSYLPLKTNAMYVVNLIDQLKCINGRDKIPPPFVVIGESMSGLIARYALCYMETPAYYKDGSKCQSLYMHNTRLLVELDAPNQGANIPIADQYLYKYITSLFIPFNAVTRGIFGRYLTLLNGSASEMLINHISTDNFPAFPIGSSPFGPSAARINFVNDLNSIGNYPEFCKKVALSNGSIEGHNQIRSWDLNPRVPNDKIIDLDAEIYLRVLGIKILGSHHSITMNTAPLGTGPLFKATAGISHWKIKLKWFGVKLVWGTTYYLTIDKKGVNMLPIDVSAGSYMINSAPFIANADFNFLGLLGFRSSVSGGTLTATGEVGIPWFSNTNLNFTAYSDGIGFNFIPTQSSADFSPHPLDFNFLTNPVTTNMSNTPFDVIYPHYISNNPRYFNGQHLDVLSPQLQVCATCLSGNPTFDPVSSYLLNREIGDDTLWLENTNAGIGFRNIEAEQVLYANEPNIYYNYPSSNSALIDYRYGTSDMIQVMSKENPYQITTTIPNTFRSNSSFIINPLVPISGPYAYYTGTMTICCKDYSNYKMLKPLSKSGISANASSLSVYPNPQKGNKWATIQYQFQENHRVSIELFDLLGRNLHTWHPQFEDNTGKCHFPVQLDFAEGIYLLKVSNGKQTLSSRIVITY